ncbi:exo-alpha-sialidase [Sinomicrobium sp. FJxs]|uniref:exo-alpha-sialidase n=2 Tax=Sinomicrobium weinanense TaxID=2842200 RepID=A0A926Q0I9_9FLAO|nr:exo-alpha-sialidase [Sinomicrobium weinanense]MBU3125177.1 exo-alpha-sialidase [Sinomicrobium weinanense]
MAACNNQKEVHKITVNTRQPVLPVLANKEKNKVLAIRFNIPEDSVPGEVRVKSFTFGFKGTTQTDDIAEALVLYASEDDFSRASLFGSVTDIGPRAKVTGEQYLDSGEHYFWLAVRLKGTPDLLHKIGAQLTHVGLDDKNEILEIAQEPSKPQRIGIAVRQKHDDGADTYRIPGLATTNKGALIAVYDVRYNNSADLQEDIDVGMSRSTDGGQTWENMKIIMDMKEYGGRPQDENGIGDPAVLVDRKTNTIWVAALWLSGNKGKRAWNASKPGMTPEETGQFVLVKSEDDGLTWSDPINITPQIKDPDWQLFFNGPGSGITMKDGTLVFAAQYKDKDKVPYSTIIYSRDGGKTWHVGTGAKSDTTEAQVVELSDGSLMLNMRDNRNHQGRKDSLNGRSVAITRDMGKTWAEHPTSRKALQESTCMASIIEVDVAGKNSVLFFSNPDSRAARDHITIKASIDDGMSWPQENQLEIYEENTYGYSCLTQVDKDHAGILYEGRGDLYFQKIPIEDIFSGL